MQTGHQIVDQISQMPFTGNIIPEMWYKNLTFANKKPHFVAITILAEVIYWYRARIVRNEKTGETIHCKKKFKADKLQRSYQSFSDQFGFTKRQAKDAIDYLVERNILYREFRCVKKEDGTVFNNVLFLEPVPENIQKITFERLDHAEKQLESDRTMDRNDDET